MGVTICFPTLPEGVELDPFGQRNSGYVIYQNGKLFKESLFTNRYGIKVAPKPGYALSGGEWGSPVLIERLVPPDRTVKPDDFYKEVQELFALAADEDRNYLGLTIVDFMSAAIAKREERIAMLETALARISLATYLAEVGK